MSLSKFSDPPLVLSKLAPLKDQPSHVMTNLLKLFQKNFLIRLVKGEPITKTIPGFLFPRNAIRFQQKFNPTIDAPQWRKLLAYYKLIPAKRTQMLLLE